jgi:hypothetical protein
MVRDRSTEPEQKTGCRFLACCKETPKRARPVVPTAHVAQNPRSQRGSRGPSTPPPPRPTEASAGGSGQTMGEIRVDSWDSQQHQSSESSAGFTGLIMGDIPQRFNNSTRGPAGSSARGNDPEGGRSTAARAGHGMQRGAPSTAPRATSGLTLAPPPRSFGGSSGYYPEGSLEETPTASQSWPARPLARHNGSERGSALRSRSGEPSARGNGAQATSRQSSGSLSSPRSKPLAASPRSGANSLHNSPRARAGDSPVKYIHTNIYFPIDSDQSHRGSGHLTP